MNPFEPQGDHASRLRRILGPLPSKPKAPLPGLPGAGTPSNDAAEPDRDDGAVARLLAAAEGLRLIRDAKVDAAVAVLGPVLDSYQGSLSDGLNRLDQDLRAAGAAQAEVKLVVETLLRRTRAKLAEAAKNVPVFVEQQAIYRAVLIGAEYANADDAELSLRRSRVFEVDLTQLQSAAEAVRADDLHSPYLIAPFPRFAIIPTDPIPCHSGSVTDARLTAIWVDADREEWAVYARYEYDGRRGPESYVFSRAVDTVEGVLVSPDIETMVSRLTELSRRLGAHWEEPDILRGILAAEASEGDIGTLIRYAVGFALLLNARGVEVVPKEPRDLGVRDEEIDGDGPRARRPRYRILVPPTRSVRSAISRVRRGEDFIARRPHWVRKHPRTLASGLVVRVRRHTRGGNPGIYLPLYALRPPTPDELRRA